MIINDAIDVGGWGGRCLCPNSGKVYYVGDNLDRCGSLACVGGHEVPLSWKGSKGEPVMFEDGKEETCNKETKSKWAGKRVICEKSLLEDGEKPT